MFKETLSEAVSSNPIYFDIKGQKTLDTRYLTEDLPMGLVPFIELGRALGFPVAHMESVNTMGQLLLGRDLMSGARTLENLGIDGMNAEEIVRFVETGKR